MLYLHGSKIMVHGRLRSTNCVIDGHFKLKLVNFGLEFFYYADITDKILDFEKIIFVAPEIIREIDYEPIYGTQEGDVYSFALVVYEIVTRQIPFYERSNLTPSKLIQELEDWTETDEPLRPTTEPLGECSEQLYALIVDCWEEVPEERPTFIEVKSQIRSLLLELGDKENLLDDLLGRMREYAENLKSLVNEKSRDLMEEKAKVESLLREIFPASIAAMLQQNLVVPTKTFESVTIYFSDIVGFPALTAKSTPLEIVSLLHLLYTCFDDVIAQFDVYKVETIGDAYMVVSGLPEPNEYRHAANIAAMALDFLRASNEFSIPHLPAEALHLRIGMNSGPCAAGILGLTNPRYCLFGDTVNTASRMESTGEAHRIHVSPTTKALLDEDGRFELQERGLIEMKGKGYVMTYWLIGWKAGAKIIQKIRSVDKEAVEALASSEVTQSVYNELKQELFLKAEKDTGKWSFKNLKGSLRF